MLSLNNFYYFIFYTIAKDVNEKANHNSPVPALHIIHRCKLNNPQALIYLGFQSERYYC